MPGKPPPAMPRPQQAPVQMWVSGRALERLGLKYADLAAIREGRSLQQRAQALRRQQGLPPFETR